MDETISQLEIFLSLHSAHTEKSVKNGNSVRTEEVNLSFQAPGSALIRGPVIVSQFVFDIVFNVKNELKKRPFEQLFDSRNTSACRLGALAEFDAGVAFSDS